MDSKSKKSQVTIFIILVLLLVIAVVSLLLISRYNIVKTARLEILETKETTLDIQPINKFVTECLSIVSKDALLKIGRQGGYLFTSQGGTLIDYLDTDEGLFYVNREGLWQLVSLGQGDIQFSDQEVLTSNLLGNTFFDNINLDDADIVKDDKTNTLLITVRQDSSSNNFIITYNTEFKAFGTFTGLDFNTFLNDNGTIFAGKSSTAKVFEIFKGNDDDSIDIFHEFEQELSVGQLWTRKELLGQYIQGELSPSSDITIKFSIFDRDGKFIKDKLKLNWAYSVSDLTSVGYGDSPWGSAWGGDVDPSTTVEQFAGAKERIKNFQRIRVNISGNDKVPHVVNWISILTKEKVNIRRRNLTVA